MYFRTFLLVVLAIAISACTNPKSNKKTVENTEPIVMNETPTTLYVVAPSGLNLRASSDPKSKKYDTVPFGEPVKFLEESAESITVNGQTGKMVKVDYLQTKGYMFDAFLSKDKPTQHIFNWANDSEEEKIRLYFPSDDLIVGNGTGELPGDGINWFYTFSGKKKDGNTFLVKVSNENPEEDKIDLVEEVWTIKGKKLTKKEKENTKDFVKE